MFEIAPSETEALSIGSTVAVWRGCSSGAVLSERTKASNKQIERIAA